MQEKYWFLKNCRLFERLEASQLDWLEARSRLRRFTRSSMIYLPADQSDGVLLLAEGRVKISSLTAEGKQSILTFIEPGEVFGELALFQRGDREEFAEATEDSAIVLIPAESMRKVAEESPHLAMGVTRLVGLRRRRVERRLRYLLFHSNRERLVNLLLELAEDFGLQQADGSVTLRIKLSHQDLASIIGSTRESVTVILGQLQTEGHLELGRRRITLKGLDGLAKSIDAATPEVAASHQPWSTPPRIAGNPIP